MFAASQKGELASRLTVKITKFFSPGETVILNWKNKFDAGLKTAAFAAKKFIYLGLLVGIAFTGQVHADLANGSFEDPDTGPLPTARYIPQALVPHWQTTATTQIIEIWSNGFNGVSAYAGKQHAELNSDQASTLFQDVSGIGAGLTVGFEFAHRARMGTDVMRLTITDLGADNAVGGGDDLVLFTNAYSATTLNWNFNTSIGAAPIVALGHDVRFAYEAISTGSGDLTKGNFIDAASFGVGVAVPEPSTATFLCGLAGLGMLFRRRRTNLTVTR